MMKMPLQSNSSDEKASGAKLHVFGGFSVL